MWTVPDFIWAVSLGIGRWLGSKSSLQTLSPRVIPAKRALKFWSPEECVPVTILEKVLISISLLAVQSDLGTTLIEPDLSSVVTGWPVVTMVRLIPILTRKWGLEANVTPSVTKHATLFSRAKCIHRTSVKAAEGIIGVLHRTQK